MRKRITYIQGPNAQYDKKQTKISKKVLSIRGLDASRQEQVTFSIDEVSDKVNIKKIKKKNMIMNRGKKTNANANSISKFK